MPDPALDCALRESTEEILEKMFFAQCLGVLAEPVSEPEVVASLTFEGNPSGALTVHVTTGVARTVAADFLGAEVSEVSEQQVRDVICELANMICGSVLSRVESSTTFRLAAPRTVAAEGQPDTLRCDAGASTAVHTVQLDGGQMFVRIDTETPACQPAAKSAF